jgi:transcriptional regulator with XRE-family HTH domain
MEFSQRLKDLRIENGYTQVELAKKVGVISTLIQKWEWGKVNPGKENIENLTKVFNVSTSYLLGETDSHFSSEIDEVMGTLSKEHQIKVVTYAKKLRKNQGNNN